MRFHKSAKCTNDGDVQSSDADKFIVKYRHDLYDISRFVSKHPGGINAFKGLKNADMTKRFMNGPLHSDAAMYLLNQYKNNPGVRICNGTRGNFGIGMKQIEKKWNNNQIDESMEQLVDWTKAMVPQIARISEHYDEWVHKPVDRTLRLFDQWYLEMCTKTPWWIIPLFWIPLSISLIREEFSSNWTENNTTQVLLPTFYFFTGILLWTLLEYSLHRWVFHVKVTSNTKGWLCTLHFLIHGLHHKVPFDSHRLVFPPIPGLVIASFLYTPIYLITSHSKIIMAGGIFGYICYDLMHYYLHYGNPTMNHMYHMKRYHFQHHFAHQNLGFGITSPLWDVVFNTRIQLRTLRYQLMWK